MIEVGPGIYKVASDSSDKEYIVDLTGAVHSCTCTAWAIGRNRAISKGNTAPPCKHIAYVTSHGGTAVPKVNKQAANKTASALADLLAELSDEPEAKPETVETIAQDVLKPDFDAARLLDVESTPVEEAPPVIAPQPAEETDPVVLAYNALGVILKDAKIAAWLHENDPKAHAQASDAFLHLEHKLHPVPQIPVTVLLPSEHPVCPRCTGYIPSNEKPGQYPGALSRVDNTTEICSACGTDEGMEQFLDGRLTPRAEWPVKNRKYDFPQASIK